MRRLVSLSGLGLLGLAGPWLLACNPTALPARAACLPASGSVLAPGPRVIANGEPGTLEDGQNCVESGHAGAQKGVTFVSVDNPRVWTQTTLASVQTSEGRFAQELVSTSGGWSGAHCAFDAAVSGGDAWAVSGASVGVDGPIVPWTAVPGHWGAADAHQLNLLTQGLRIGYRATELQMSTTTLTPTPHISAFPVTIAMDPDVMLVPVQAVAVWSPGHPVSKGRLSNQLALWDRVATGTSQNVTNGSGELITANRVLQPWVRGGEKSRDEASVGGWWLPDDLFEQCGIQFRLVNYLEAAVTDADANPPEPVQGSTMDVQSPLRHLLPQIRRLPGFLDDVPTVVFTPMCTPQNTNEPGGLQPPTGITVLGVACVSTSQQGPAVPAHELGHVVMGSEHFCPIVAANGEPANLMCPAGPGTSLTTGQCAKARQFVASYSKKYFPKPSVTVMPAHH